MKNTLISISFLTLSCTPLAAQTTSVPAGCEQQYTVPVVNPSADYDFWLANGAMMLGWRKNYNYRVSDIIGFLPERLREDATNSEVLTIGDTDTYLNRLGMLRADPENGGFTQAQICDMLNRYGPIWMFSFRRGLNAFSYIIYGSTTIGGTLYFQIIVAGVTGGGRFQVPFTNLASRQRIRGSAAFYPGQ